MKSYHHVQDLQVSLGNLSGNNDCSSDFGIEGSGIVTAVGPEARRFRVSDRVAFSHSGSLSTSVILSETLCAEIPDTMTLKEAASIPYSYGTALYGLMEIGRLKKGQVGCPFGRNSYAANSSVRLDSFSLRCAWSSGCSGGNTHWRRGNFLLSDLYFHDARLLMWLFISFSAHSRVQNKLSTL